MTLPDGGCGGAVVEGEGWTGTIRLGDGRGGGWWVREGRRKGG